MMQPPNDSFDPWTFSQLAELTDRSETPGEYTMANGVRVKRWMGLMCVTSACKGFYKLVTPDGEVWISIEGELFGTHIHVRTPEPVEPPKAAEPPVPAPQEAPALISEGSNFQHLRGNFFIVTTQAGFRAILKAHGWSKDVELRGHPNSYPSLVCVTAGYEGYHFLQADCLHIDRKIVSLLCDKRSSLWDRLRGLT